MSSFFGFLHGANQYGRWVPQPEIKAKALAGGSTLDFSQALFTHPVITVHACAFWGGVTVIVPPNVNVEQNGKAILGGFGAGGGVYHSSHGSMPTTASNSDITIKIIGTAVMGAVGAIVNRNAEPAQLISWEEASTIIQLVPAPASTSREDVRQQIIGDALTRRISSAPPVAAAALQHSMLQQGVHPTLLQSRQRLQVGVVQGVPLEAPCK